MHLQISCKCNTCCKLNGHSIKHKQHISRFRELSMVFFCFCFYFGVFFENLKIHQRYKKLNCKEKSIQLYNFDFTLKDIHISCIFFFHLIIHDLFFAVN